MDQFSKYGALELTHFFSDPLVILDGQSHPTMSPTPLSVRLDQSEHSEPTVHQWTMMACESAPGCSVGATVRGGGCPLFVQFLHTTDSCHATLLFSPADDGQPSQQHVTVSLDSARPRLRILPRLTFAQSYTIRHGASPMVKVKVRECGMLTLEAKLCLSPPAVSSSSVDKTKCRTLVVKFGVGLSTIHVFLGHPNASAGSCLVARGWIKPTAAMVQVAAGVDVVGIMALLAMVVQARQGAVRFWRLDLES